MSSIRNEHTPWSVLSLLLYLWLILAFLIAWGMPHVNEDLFVALRNGSLAWHGKLTAPDDTSFTREGRIFVNKAWLSNIVLYLSYQSAREFGPVLVKGLLLGGCIVLLFVRCSALGITQGVSLVALTLGTLALAPFLGLRAENFGMFCLVLMGTMVNGPSSWGRWRQTGSIAAVVLWANCHATFVIGFGFLVLRTLLDLLYARNLLSGFGHSKPLPKDGQEDESHVHNAASGGESDGREVSYKPDFWGWLITTILAAVITAIANPYGLSYLEIPVSRFTQWQHVIQWGDYLPLLHMPSIFQDRLFKAFCVLPFLALLMIVVALFLFLVATLGLKGAFRSFMSRNPRIDPLMECAVALMMLPLVFKWQRLVIFAAPAMIPVLAMLLRSSLAVLRERCLVMESPNDEKKKRRVAVISASAGLVVLMMVFFTSVVRLYLPGNPTSPTLVERPLIGRLMSSHLVADQAVEFMRRNRITGRVFATFQLADYLLFRLDGIKVFFDLRAHAAYDFQTFDEYFSVIETGPNDVERTLELLNKWQVDVLVLDTMVERRASTLAVELMGSRQWGCIYKDEWIFILVPTDSARFGPMIQSANLDPLWYGNPETKIVSEAFLFFFQKGSLSRELVDGLKSVVRNRPDPEIYNLIVSAVNGRNRCLTASTKTFLESEMDRLLQSDYMVAGGVTYTLASLSHIAGVLEANEALCSGSRAVGVYEEVRSQTQNTIKRLQGEYSMF